MPDKKGKSQIEKLAEFVDDNYVGKPRFMGWKPFLTKNWFNLFTVIFFTLLLMLLILYISDISKAVTLNLAQLETGIALALLLSLAAGLTAIINLFFSVLNFIKPAAINEDLITHNYQRLKEKIVEKDELPLLKALIIMKSKNPEFNLKNILRSYDESLFRTKLFEILYTNTDLEQSREVTKR